MRNDRGASGIVDYTDRCRTHGRVDIASSTRRAGQGLDNDIWTKRGYSLPG